MSKAKTPDVYSNKFYMECCNFFQQCKDHFAIYEAIKPNQIPFITFFLQDQINFYWQQHK